MSRANTNATAVPKRKYKSKLPWKFLLLLASSLLILVSLFSILMDLGLHAGWTTTVTVLFSAWAMVYLFSTYKYHRSVYLFTTAYLISLTVFHLGHIISDSLG